jgi:hypothetical protein
MNGTIHSLPMQSHECTLKNTLKNTKSQPFHLCLRSRTKVCSASGSCFSIACCPNMRVACCSIDVHMCRDLLRHTEEEESASPAGGVVTPIVEAHSWQSIHDLPTIMRHANSRRESARASLVSTERENQVCLFTHMHTHTHTLVLSYKYYHKHACIRCTLYEHMQT